MSQFKCYECNRLGEWDEGPQIARSSAQLYPEYIQVKCPECKGTGKVNFPMCCMCRGAAKEVVHVEDAIWCKDCHEQFTADMESVG